MVGLALVRVSSAAGAAGAAGAALELVVDVGRAATAAALRRGSVAGGIHGGGLAQGGQEAWGACAVQTKLGVGASTVLVARAKVVLL